MLKKSLSPHFYLLPKSYLSNRAFHVKVTQEGGDFWED